MTTELADAAHAIADSLRSCHGIVAIDGPSGSGKSSFADSLVARLTEFGRPPLLIRTDDYATWNQPAAWWPELERDVLAPFLRSHDIAYRPRIWHDADAGSGASGSSVSDAGSGASGSPLTVPRIGPVRLLRWAPLLIIEGVTAARQSIADRLDRAFWIEGPPADERLARTVARDGEEQREYLAAWQRFEDGWFAVDGTRARCDVVACDG